eukprot:764691-Alexandrium_andersonii.AAC.1
MVFGLEPELAAALCRFQLDVRPDGDGHRIAGASGKVLGAILTACRSRAILRPFQHERRCKVKTAVVPAAGAGAWRHACRLCKFGNET